MKILILGKCPPIQGGVSWMTLRTCLELAERGHEVHLVTNADEVEPGFRQLLSPSDVLYAAGEHQPGFHRHAIAPLGNLGHIPDSPEYGARLFAKALEVVMRVQPHLIVGWYFQPYGLCAAQVSQATGIPFGVIHAGSDLMQLAQHPDLHRAFTWMADAAAAVFTVDMDEVGAELEKLGVPIGKRQFLKGHLPLHESYRDPAPLDLDELRKLSAPHILSYPVDQSLLRRVCVLNEKPLDHDVPTIGIYGKVGEAKGTYDLMAALTLLARRDIRFNFVAVAAGDGRELERFCAAMLKDSELSRRSWIFPPLAPWRIPGFLRACDIVCCLERGFDIPSHFPAVPLEVLSCGVCLMCSREIAGKPLYRSLLLHQDSCMIVDDPRDVTALAGQIERVIQDAGLRDSVALEGLLMAAKFYEQLGRKQLIRHVFADAIESAPRRTGHFAKPASVS